MADLRRNIGIPSGVVFPFAGTTAPYGYLICDGRAISRTDYADLFMMIGTSHGIGDGSTTFNLPDYRGNFLRGRMDITTVTGSGTVSSNNATFTSHGINRTGFKVRLSSGTLTGLSTATDYYAIVVDSNTLAFATTLTNALAGTKDVTISGTNSAVLVQYEDPDRSTVTVGHRQDEANKSHQHFVFSNTVANGNYGIVTNTTYATRYEGLDQSQDYEIKGASDGASVGLSSPTGGNETRPKNITINYIIKV